MAAPKNPHPYKSEKEWREAIKRALGRVAEGRPRALERVANKLIEKALEGDMTAIKEIGDRIDGRAVTPVEAKVEGNITVEIVQFSDNIQK